MKAKQVTALIKKIDEGLLRRIQENTFRAGYWISPSGSAFPVNSNHIATVIQSPEKFGYSKEEIEAVYRKHGEPVGQEGNAREEIILALIKKGWTRGRHYSSRSTGEYWSINVSRLSDRIRDHITSFFQKLIPNGSYTDVVIDSPQGVERMTVSDINRFKLFAEGLETLRPVNFCSGIQDFQPTEVDR